MKEDCDKVLSKLTALSVMLADMRCLKTKLMKDYALKINVDQPRSIGGPSLTLPPVGAPAVSERIYNDVIRKSLIQGLEKGIAECDLAIDELLNREETKSPTSYKAWAQGLVDRYDHVHFPKDHEFCASDAKSDDLVVYEQGVRGAAATFTEYAINSTEPDYVRCTNYPGSHAVMDREGFETYVKRAGKRNNQ